MEIIEESTNAQPKNNLQDNHHNLQFWMTNLPHKLRTISIIYLAIPGSHDSMTFAITSKSHVAPDAEPIVQRLKCLGPLTRFVMSKWSKTQAFNVTHQLNYGIRYFDLRISTKAGEESFYFVHGLYSEPIDRGLEEFRAFLESHPGEVIILDCQHFYEFSQANHETLMVQLTSKFGHKMLPYTPYMDHLSLEFLTKQCHYQVIVVYRSDAARFGQPLLWPSSCFPTPWPNTTSVTKLIRSLDCGLRNRNFKVGYVTQCVLTPTPWFVLRNFFGSLKSQCVLPLEKQKYQWLSKQKPGQGGINIVISDFVDYQSYQFCCEVVGLNLKLIGDNKEETSPVSDLTPVTDD